MKKLLKNKMICLLFILIYISVLLFLIINNNYLYTIVFIILSISVVIFVYKKLFNISFINLDKIKKNRNYGKLKKNINEDEIYSENMNISTFDGSNEFTHPSVLYFEKGFNGYKYWMAYTPYHNCNVNIENPCIAVSNDGINFIKPLNINNPLLPIVKNEKNAKKIEYYNDPNLIYANDKLELWYRYTVETIDKKYQQKIYRIISDDGITWSKPELMLEDKNNENNLISISILYDNNEYKIFYFDLELKPTFISTKDFTNYTKPKRIIIKDYKGTYWHGEVKKINNIYVYLYTDNKYNLYIALSKNGIKFNNPKRIDIICNSKDYFYFKNVLYKSSIVEDEEYYYLYVPFRFDKIRLFKTNNVIYHTWITTVTKIKKENFYKIEKDV